ncbi:VC0807 family protein [Actinomycetospora sp. OC33-EN08]|uniref:VC0807 family protein n=1 Tax=Actinomycetospora aurantiaca TaxID=3129233 RepID=A0ABU8MS19_9PSEU
MTIAADPETAPDTPREGRWAPLVGLAWDVGLPLVTYYVLHALGVSDWSALLVATLAAGLRVAWVAVRARRITWFAALMVVVFGIGLVLSVVGGDARFLILKDSFTTGGVGLVFLVSLLGVRPLTFSAYRTWQPREAAELDAAWDSEPGIGRTFRISAVVWGVGLLAEAALRVPLVYALPVDVAVGASTALQVVTFVGLGTWNAVYAYRVRQRYAA